MTDSGVGFELLGVASDETRMLVHRASGYSIPIPGRPVLRDPVPGAKPTYDAIAMMTDLQIELGFRIDRLPTETDPQALAIALATAYGNARATEPPQLRPLAGDNLAKGATAGAWCSYLLRDVPDRTMEQLEVSTRSDTGGVSALYFTVRYPIPIVNPVQWAHFHAAIRGHQRWNTDAIPTIAPTLWPESAFALSGVALTFTREADREADQKAAELGVIADDQTAELLKILLEFSNNDVQPTMELPQFLKTLIPNRLIAHGPADVAQVLLRNFDQIKTMHDLRAWIWQCIWAMGNRASRRN